MSGTNLNTYFVVLMLNTLIKMAGILTGQRARPGGWLKVGIGERQGQQWLFGTTSELTILVAVLFTVLDAILVAVLVALLW